MNLQDKIDEIRQKPEHIRLRYVWVLTAISMIFVIIIWILSAKSQLSGLSAPQLTNDQQGVLDEFGQQKQSIQDATNQIKNSLQSPPPNQDQSANQSQPQNINSQDNSQNSLPNNTSVDSNQ
jgi:predicted PurR-regulated permease PerM